jgi:hypothetical protein
MQLTECSWELLRSSSFFWGLMQEAAVQKGSRLLMEKTAELNAALDRQSQLIESTIHHQWAALEQNAAALAQWLDNLPSGTDFHLCYFFASFLCRQVCLIVRCVEIASYLHIPFCSQGLSHSSLSPDRLLLLCILPLQPGFAS